ncbi:MAG: sensor histidine kinase [Candidatus Kapaibacterium sp.]
MSESSNNKNTHSGLAKMDEFVHDRDEYIRSLESALDLLQREVEHLRSISGGTPPHPEDKPQPHHISFDARQFYAAASEEQVIARMHENISRDLNIAESNLYFFSADRRIAPVAPGDAASRMDKSILHMEEEGILDWAIEQGETSVVPDLASADATIPQHIILIPVFLRGREIGLFAALTTRTPDEIPGEELYDLLEISGHAAAAVDNIRSAREITRMNQRLSTLNKQMLQSSRYFSIGELAASIASELKSPLDIIDGNLTFIETGVGDPARRFELIRKELDRMRQINRKLSELAGTSPQQKPSDINICQIIDEVLLFSEAQMQRDGIRFERDYAIEKPIVFGFKPQLEQAFLNILLNARDTMPDGGTIYIGVFAGERKKIVISIRDTGIGLDEDMLARIFDPNFSLRPGDEPTGRGLFLSNSIIGQHRGEISVHSHPGKGATYRITFPQKSK